jgi:hypothetical protein
MVISKRLLPLLVRQTAINAYRAYRLNNEAYERPWVTRAKTMQEIESKFTRQNVSNFSLLRNVLTPQQQQ